MSGVLKGRYLPRHRALSRGSPQAARKPGGGGLGCHPTVLGEGVPGVCCTDLIPLSDPGGVFPCGTGCWGVPVAAGCWGGGGRCLLLPSPPGYAVARPGRRRWRSPVCPVGVCSWCFPRATGSGSGESPRIGGCRVDNGAEEMLSMGELLGLAGAGTTRSRSWKLKLA